MKKAKRIVAVALLLCMVAALASGEEWTRFDQKHIPEGLGFVVCEYTGDVKLTFLGDCTLGGEEKMAASRYGFAHWIEQNGMDWPFRSLQPLIADDDITVANLEGVLSDRRLTKREKEYNFIGPTAYTAILTEGSIECVTLANNHTQDYGEEGLVDTRAALNTASVPWFDGEESLVWERDGLMIGFVGIHYAAYGKHGKDLQERIRQLREMGCAAVITVMHAGEEHTQVVTDKQKQIARLASEAGSCLIVGHHPHVVQGYEAVNGIPVAYSLGNCSFGGSSIPDDMDALALQVELSFEEGELIGETLHFYPISISGTEKLNDYSPVLLHGTDTVSALQKMQRSTGVEMPAFSEEAGSVIEVCFR